MLCFFISHNELLCYYVFLFYVMKYLLCFPSVKWNYILCSLFYSQMFYWSDFPLWSETSYCVPSMKWNFLLYSLYEVKLSAVIITLQEVKLSPVMFLLHRTKFTVLSVTVNILPSVFRVCKNNFKYILLAFSVLPVSTG